MTRNRPPAMNADQAAKTSAAAACFCMLMPCARRWPARQTGPPVSPQGLEQGSRGAPARAGACPARLIPRGIVPGSVSHSVGGVRLCATPWTVACQAPLFMGLPRQEYWRGLPFPSPGDLPDPGIKPGSPALQAVSLPSEPSGKPNIRALYNYNTELLQYIYYNNWPSHMAQTVKNLPAMQETRV